MSWKLSMINWWSTSRRPAESHRRVCRTGVLNGAGADAGAVPRAPRPAGLLLGYLADLAFGDPRRHHPVAGFGRVALLGERTLYADRRSAGAVQVGVLVGSTVAIGMAAERVLRDRPLVRTLLTAAGTWAVLGGRSLRAEAAAVGSLLERGDLAAARIQITHLVGRDPATLDAGGVARACVESVAENTSDAVVGPLFWGALAGLPGLLGYRAINTLDAMIGTAATATSGSAGPRPDWTTWSTCCPPGSPHDPCAWPRCWVAGPAPRSGSSCGTLAGTPAPMPGRSRPRSPVHSG